MKNGTQETKDVVRANEQKTRMDSTSTNLLSASVRNEFMLPQDNFVQARASATTAQASSDAPTALPNHKFPVVSTVHEVFQLRHKPNPPKGMTRPLKTMANEEKKQRPKTRKKSFGGNLSQLVNVKSLDASQETLKKVDSQMFGKIILMKTAV